MRFLLIILLLSSCDLKNIKTNNEIKPCKEYKIKYVMNCEFQPNCLAELENGPQIWLNYPKVGDKVCL